MRATYEGRARQVDRVRAAFADLLEVPLTSITAARIDQWRAERRNRRGSAKGGSERRVSSSAINRDLAALQAALSRAVEWGQLEANPLARFKRLVEDESALVRYLSHEEESRLREALTERDDRRRRARESANAGRRQRRYEPWPPYGTFTDHLTPLVLLAVITGLRRRR
jgi:hypothetical protein